MSLPHNESQSELSIPAALALLANGEETDIELAASRFFSEDEYEGDDFGEFMVQVSSAYDNFFKESVAEVTKSLGEPVYIGALPDAFEWADKLDIEASFEQIQIWKKGDKHIFLQITWEDKDCPVVVTLGARSEN
jgi:hypothetical protein